jgi:hypothetical protein
MTDRMRAVGRRFWLALSLAAIAGPVSAIDGVIEINQASALAGGVTPTDTPGLPVTIDSPGSYRLTGSLVASPGQTNVHAIVVTTAAGVTIDLNGFVLQGPSVCSNLQACTPAGTARGIDANGPAVRVRNGTVRGFPGGGLVLGVQTRIDEVHAIGNGGDGIRVQDFAIVTACSVSTNVAHGIHAGMSSTLDRNTADTNGGNGIQTGVGSLITRNATAGNAIGIAAGGTSIVSQNSARANTSVGIACTGCSLVANSAHGNNGVGFQLDSSSGYAQSVLRANNGGSDQPQVEGGIDFGQNLCGAVDLGNGIACP